MKTRIEEHEISLAKTTSAKLGLVLTIAVHARAESHYVDCKTTGILRLAFGTCAEHKSAETIAISTHFTCVNGNEEAEPSEMRTALTSLRNKDSKGDNGSLRHYRRATRRGKQLAIRVSRNPI